MSIVKVSHITKRFNDKLVLDNISFEIKEGTIFGLIGPNGAGKSTLMNILTTLVEANSGSIEICGYDLKTNPIEAKRNIGLVPQELALLEDMNAVDNLMFFGSLYGLSGRVLKERMNEALEVTGLSDRRKEKVKKFSGGMKRRLNIAAALMHHPRILIMDEPTVGVDPQSRNHIFEFTKKIASERGTTVIYTSHYMEEIEELCSEVFIIDLGQEIAYGSKEHIKSLSSEHTKIMFEIKDLKAELIYQLKQVKNVISLTHATDNVTLVVDKSFKLTDAIKLIEDNGAILTKISYDEPKLEDVFLALTGKTLRD